MIPWRPLAELPDALKDGREVLVWAKGEALVVTWFVQEFEDGGGWWESDIYTIGYDTPTHFAEINPPA